MFCRNCGKQIPEGSAFCAECGYKVRNTSTNEVQAEAMKNDVPASVAQAEAPVNGVATSVAQVNETAVDNIGAPIREEKPKKKKTGLIVGIILLLILALAAVAAFLLLNSDSRKFDKLLASAEELMDDEEYADAAEILEEALEIKEDDEDAKEMLIEAYEALVEEYLEDGEEKKAEKIMKKLEALEDDADDKDGDDDDDDDGKDVVVAEPAPEPTPEPTPAPTPEPTPEPVVEETEGKVLNIYCYNDEFKRQVEYHYPGYEENSGHTGKIGDVTVNWYFMSLADNAYQNYLDSTLMKQRDANDDDKIDIFLVDSDFAIKYVDSDFTLPISSLGITQNDIADQYKYTQEFVTDSFGELKALSWMGYPGALVYNREIAKEVFGTDDPATVQQYVQDWNCFVNTAELMANYGYDMVSTVFDTYRTYADNVSTSWVVDGRIIIDENIMNWVYDSKYLIDLGVAGTHGLWTDEWFNDMYPEGKVFCYFAPTWMVDYSMDGEVEGSVAYNGDWAVTEGPQAFFWGGTWICAARGTDNEELIKDIMLAMTANEEIMMSMMCQTGEFVNNQEVMENVGLSDFYKDYLGGQNPALIYHANALKLDKSNTTAYDMGCNEEFQEAMYQYFIGNCSFEEALDYFYRGVMEKYPELSK